MQDKDFLTVETAAAMKAIAANNPPNWVRCLATYQSNWTEAIGATIIRADNYGATVVAWCGHTYIRRTGNSKYGDAIWFSRCIGKDQNGDNQYVRLITFKERATPQAEPLPGNIASKLNS